MEVDRSESRHEHRGGSDDRNDSPNQGKDRKKSSRRQEKDHRSKERERLRRSGGDDVSKERRKDDRGEREKDKNRINKVREDRDGEKSREKERERDKDRKDRVKEKDREKERDVEKDGERGREKERGKGKNMYRDKERVKVKERDRARDIDRGRGREKHEEKKKGKERDADQGKEKSRDRASRKNIQGDCNWTKDGRKEVKPSLDYDSKKDRDVIGHPTTTELKQRILKMKEERTKKKTEDESDMLSWANKIRKIEAKRNTDKKKALHMSKLFEEQDNIVQGESDFEEAAQQPNLAGVKVLHGVDKVMEGGVVVLTLKDQNILADGDINEEVDMLKNVEIGEQKRRDDAYKAAKKKAGTGTYDDKFNHDPYSEKRILPLYDDPNTDEGISLDESGRIAGEAEKRLVELRRQLNGASSNNRVEDLNLPGKISSDYYTPEEMLQFKKPKKKKALRKKDKLDIDALEAEAISAGLGVSDLGSRSNAKRQTMREEQDRAEVERRDKAYQTAYAKADEASKSLRVDQALPVKQEEEEDIVFADDADDLYKSLERARKIALKTKEEDATYGPDSVARFAATIASSQTVDKEAPESQGIVFTEMEEFVRCLQLGEEAQKHVAEDLFMVEDEEPKFSEEEEVKDESSGWTGVKDIEMEENPSNEHEEEIVLDEIMHEVAVGKGLAGALKMLQERGTLKETVDWSGRIMDKKKSKVIGIVDDDEPRKTQQTRQKKDSKDFVYQEKDICIERTDEFGRTLTLKEAYRILSHTFHGKEPGKMKQEKRIKQFLEELKLKKKRSSDTPSMSVERMREAQAQLKTPYLVLSGHIKAGKTSDPRSGYATVEKDFPGGLTPMLGDRKVKHFLGIKRKPEPSNLGLSKKPKP